MNTSQHNAQQGATLVVSLILLVVITLMVTSAFTLSSGNMKAVGNMQVREEAIAASNLAIERLISSDTIFFSPQATTATVAPYSVAIATPVCTGSVEIKTNTSADPNPNVMLDGGPSGGGGVISTGYKITYWDIAATVSDTATGARSEVHQGVKITLPATPEPCP